jgi:hypothetical protein
LAQDQSSRTPEVRALLLSVTNEEKLVRKIEESRKAYIPNVIPDVREHDHLFLAVMKVLYPELHDSYLSLRRATGLKADILSKFQSDGFYLLDLFESSSAINKTPTSQAVKTMIESMSRIATSETPIILIKASVYDILAKPLVKAGFTNLVRERIPFPLYKWVPVFHERFLRALSNAGYVPGGSAG